MYMTVSRLLAALSVFGAVRGVLNCRQMSVIGYASNNLCSNYNTSSAQINVFTCPDTKSCKAADIAAAELASTFTSYCLDYINPYDYTLSLVQQGSITTAACNQAPSVYFTLMEGTHPKFCFDQSDCQYTDGFNGTCTCGIDGFSYCQPRNLDIVWKNYYTAACVQDYNEMMYWQAFISAVPYVTNANSYQYQTIRELVDLNSATAHRISKGSVNATGCPKIACGFVDTNECTRFNGTYYELYPNCLSGQYCLLSNTMASIRLGFGTVICSPETIRDASGANAEVILFTICAANPTTQAQLTERLSGTNPKLCQTNSDCPLVNGNFGLCQCSLTGKMYCALNSGDPELSQMYTSACNADINATQFYYMYKSLYVLLQDFPYCAPKVFEDVQLYVWREQAMLGTAEGLGLILWGAFVLLG